MGRSMYQYGNQTKETDRQLKQIAKNLKRSLVKQHAADTKEKASPEGGTTTERNEHE